MNAFIQWLSETIKSVQLWVAVMPWERCVRVRAGKYTKILEPGYHFKIPFGVDRTWPVNTRLRFAGIPAQTLTTADEKTITVGGLVAFRIVDPLAAMMAVVQPENSCAALAQAVVAEYIPARSFEELDKDELETEAMEKLSIAAPGYQFESVKLTDWARVRAFRLLQESWRPETRPDKDPYENER